MIIVAMSGTGKTHAASRDPDLRDADQDPALAAAYQRLGKEFGSHWWDRDDYEQVVRPVKRKLMAGRIREMGQAENETWLTAELGIVSDLIRKGKLHRDNVVAWIPSVSTIHRRHLLRHQEGNSAQPVWDMGRINQVRQEYLKGAKALGLEVVTNV